VIELFVIHHSPWSERARWALLHHGIAFEEREHVPLIGELALRMRASKAKNRVKKVSVPLLVDGDNVVQGSLAIGEYVDAIGKKDKLFPEGSRAAIAALYDALEDPLSAAREAFVRDLPKSHEAQLEALPAFMRALPFAALSARVGTAFVANKYDAHTGSVDDRVRAGLRAVRDAIGEKDYVLESGFSFGDVVGTSIVQAIAPGDDKYVRIPPGTRALWEHPKLQKEFAELIAWRDRVYAKHRPVQKKR